MSLLGGTFLKAYVAVRRVVARGIIFFFVGSVIVVTCACGRTTYYISSSTGNNANNGTSPGTAWQTIDRVLFRSVTQAFQPGDSILLKRGDTFEGQFRANFSGTPALPIVIGAYGSGAKPIIRGDLYNRTWTAVPGRLGYYQTYVGYGTIMAYVHQYYSGSWYTMEGKGNTTGTRTVWLDTLGAGQWGPLGNTDTLWLHTYDGGPMIPDNMRFNRGGNYILEYSHDAIIRDLDLRNINSGIDIERSTNITVRNVSVKNALDIAIYLRWYNQGCLVDSCTTDSTGNTALYNLTGSNCIFRANTISNVVSTIRSIPRTADQSGIGTQGSDLTPQGFDVVGNNTYEYNVINNVVNAAFDYYWNIGDTVRYNTATNVHGGIYPHGTELVITGNDITGVGTFGGVNSANVGSGRITITNNIFRGVTNYGIRVDSVRATTTGLTVISGNSVVSATPNTMFTQFLVKNIKSTGNNFYSKGVWYLMSSRYATLTAFQAATGLEAGSNFYSGVLTQGSITSPPLEYELNQNYPNPFNPSTIIEFTVPTDGYVSLTVFDVLGREIAVLTRGLLTRGIHRFEWTADRMASGIYFCRLNAGSFTETRRMLLLR